MFSKHTVWQFLFSVLVLPVFVGVEAASASIPQQTEESSYGQEIEQSLVEIEDNAIEEDFALPQVQEINVDSEEIEQLKNGYYSKPRRRKSYYRRSRYNRNYKRPCRTYYRPKKRYNRVRSNRYKYGNAGYQRSPKRHYNNSYGY
ncbi:MAG: hypothetical protein AAF378_00335 [Cyanobacteria bacterium P01_A01_bin.84]